MRFLGQTEVAEFLRRNPAEAERLQAWLSEIRNRSWDSADALCVDFRSVDMSDPPQAVFQFSDPPLRIDTLIDFRTNVVLLLSIQHATRDQGLLQKAGMSSNQ